jgi:radical S-adenosyl methionine domain-containing protein 2
MPNFTRSNQLVINWHITEVCNYTCQYCYAKWDAPTEQRDLIHDRVRTRELLRRLYAFFHAENDANPLKQSMAWQSVRLNIAGGEPLLYEQKVLDMIATAKEIGFDVSLITNGSRLDQDLMAAVAPSISLLGLSIDSVNAQTNQAIGRIDRRGRLLDLTALVEAIQESRQLHPGLRLKINTVVNRVNQSEDMTDLIARLRPDKWKILRMLPIVDASLAVSQEAFDTFVTRHAHLGAVRHVEDNQDMTESYLMVDPLGRFFQNATEAVAQGYRYSPPILAVGAAEAFAAMRFSPTKFLLRYETPRTGLTG